MIAIPSKEALTDAFYQEVRKGLQLEDSLQQIREAACAQLAKAAKDAGTRGPMGGRILAYIPQKDYLQIGMKYGMECWDDPEFIRDHQKLEPDMHVNKI